MKNSIQSLHIRSIQPLDHQPLVEILSLDGLFTTEEISVAQELIEAAISSPKGDYRVLVAVLDNAIVGYICFGPTPMTQGTWDLYWVVTHPAYRGKGVARGLVEQMENNLRSIGASNIRVETSLQEGYGAARKFYEKLNYPVFAQLRDFYKPGDDLLTMFKKI